MTNNLSLREAYNIRKTSELENGLHEVKELLEEHVLIVEKLDTSTISRIVDAMNSVEEALQAVLDKLPSLKQGLDKAEEELMSLVSGKAGNNPAKTGKMLVKAMSFYRNLSSFLQQDLPVILKSRILANARSTPDQPIGPKASPVFLQALKINWANREGGFFKKLFAGSDIPYVNNESFANELANLTFNELATLAKVKQTPPVVTQAQVDQAAAQVAAQSQQTAAPAQPSSDPKAAIAKALAPHMGDRIPNELIDSILKAVKG